MLSILRCCKNQLPYTACVTKIVNRRYMKTSEKMEVLLRQRDRVNENYTLIYRHKDYSFTSKLFHGTNMLTFLIMGAVGHWCYKEYFTIPNPNEDEVDNAIRGPGDAILVTVTCMALVTFLSVLRKRYVIRLYRNDKNNTCRAVFIGRAPFTIESCDFPDRSLKYVAKNSPFPWKNLQFNANGRKLFLTIDNFKTYGDFYQTLHPDEQPLTE